MFIYSKVASVCTPEVSEGSEDFISISGTIPLLSIRLLFGVYHFAIVTEIPPPLLNGLNIPTLPLPKEVSPTILALL